LASNVCIREDAGISKLGELANLFAEIAASLGGDMPDDEPPIVTDLVPGS
jgi:hypothetical protein